MTLLTTTPAAPPLPRLRATLRANATFSAVSGLALIVVALVAPGSLGAPGALLAAVGVALAAFAALVLAIARSSPFSRPGARLIVAADVSWVVAAVVVISMGELMTPTGETLLVLSCAPVGAFAVTQTHYLRRLPSTGADVV